MPELAQGQAAVKGWGQVACLPDQALLVPQPCLCVFGVSLGFNRLLDILSF